jgi:hypothetical protein
LLCIFVLFPSCIVIYQNSDNKGKPAIIEKASSKKNTHIKIITNGGDKYKLRWIEENDGNVYSIKKTRRKYIDKKDINKIFIYNPTAIVVSLEEAINHKGNVLIRTQYESYDHSFLKISDEGDYLKGYKMTGKDTLTVSIPIDQIRKIKLMDKGGSAVVTVVAVASGIFVAFLIGIVIAYSL